MTLKKTLKRGSKRGSNLDPKKDPKKGVKFGGLEWLDFRLPKRPLKNPSQSLYSLISTDRHVLHLDILQI